MASEFTYRLDKDVARGAAIHSGTADFHVLVKAGPHRIGVTFLATQLAPQNDLDQHFLRDTIGDRWAAGFPFLSARRQGRCDWPVTSYACQPILPAARRFLSATPQTPVRKRPAPDKSSPIWPANAFRRPVTSQDTEKPDDFYQFGPKPGNFDSGVEMALQRILADPEFVFRRKPSRPPQGLGQKIPDQRPRACLPPVLFPLEAAFPMTS